MNHIGPNLAFPDGISQTASARRSKHLSFRNSGVLPLDRTVSDGRRNWGASNVSSMILGEGGFRVTRLCTRLVANARFTELNPSPHIMGNML